MATKLATPCRTPRCPHVAGRDGLCAGHHREYERRRGTPAQRGYGAAWREIRLVLLARDPICRACHAAASTEVDHIIPLRQGGTNEPENLRGLCKPCHSRKTVTEGALA